MAVWDIKERNDIVRANDNRTQKAVIFGGGSAGNASAQVIETFSMVSQGTATNFGLLSKERTCHGGTGSSSTTRGLLSGLEVGGNSDDIDYIEIAHNGNAADFGNLTAARGYAGNVANNTRAMTFGGGNSGMKNEIMFGTIANTGNFADFGDLTTARDQLAGTTSSTRAIYASGSDGASPSSALFNIIDFCTIATTGNAADFGDLTVARMNGGMTGSSTRGMYAGGVNPGANVIDFITIATTGNATDFGDLTVARNQAASASNNVYGYACGGGGGNVIDRWLIASTGNAADWADLAVNKSSVQGVTGSHGGIDLSTPDSQRPSVNYMPGSGRAVIHVNNGDYDFFNINTQGTTANFGDQRVSHSSAAGCSDLTRGVTTAERTSGSLGGDGTGKNMEYITIASTGNAADFGDLTLARYGL